LRKLSAEMKLPKTKGKKLRKLLKSVEAMLKAASRAIDEAKKLDKESKYYYMGKESALMEIEEHIRKLIDSDK